MTDSTASPPEPATEPESKDEDDFLTLDDEDGEISTGVTSDVINEDLAATAIEDAAGKVPDASASGDGSGATTPLASSPTAASDKQSKPATAASTSTGSTKPFDPAKAELKLVAVLSPTPEGYRARLAVGAPDCDPELHVALVDGVPAALHHLGLVVDAALHRWQQQRLYPAAPKALAAPAASTTGSTAAPARTPAGRAKAARTPATAPAAAPAPVPTPATPRKVPAAAAADKHGLVQPSLFG